MKRQQKEEPRMPVMVWLLLIMIGWVARSPLRRLLRRLCSMEAQPRSPGTDTAASGPSARSINVPRHDSGT